jgi:hypothetical protein
VVSSTRESELEWESDQEDELEDEQFLGDVLRGIGGALGLGEGEDEGFADQQLDGELLSEPELEDEQLIGDLLREVGLGEGEDESRLDGELEYEYEGEMEDELEGEPFLPALLPIAKMALPLIGSLFGRRRRRRPARELEDEAFGDQELETDQFLGGLLQGIGGALGLNEGEADASDLQREFEHESTAPPVMAEVLAAMAAETPSEAEAEALIGAATVMTLTPREQRLLEGLIPQLLQATTLLTRLLRRRRRTRRVVTVIPSVVTSTARPIARAAVRGHPPTTSVVGRVLTRQTRTVLTKPAVTRAAMRRNATAVRRAAGPAQAARSRRRRIPPR